ncbi:aquaporin [Renibacterium salmoninarum ATCC 33209]|uniref:Aquaporin n=1 Tax=Renibacterium salmoninarum (strain ATCC 33209 / DSM 20767 / JCM 11484 / NBRC 15589 / NCIMB 2235) TaxID=288705 RepID=A9WNL0_RENSM|nr:aquaporin [Renibacterium salmoninarum]ABY23228.1 aquaporin [Renibacterium salmoninarum ATCC 33209]
MAEAAVPTIITPEAAPKGHSLYARLGAEFLGTFIFIFAGIGGTLAVVQQNSASVQTALGFGLALVAVTVLFGKVSGGYFNPAVTLASAIAGRIKWLHALYYVVVQAVSALLAVLVLYVVFNSLPVFRTPSPNGGGVSAVFKAASNGFDASSTAQVPLYSAILIEVVATAVLVAVVLAAWRPTVNKAVAPIAIGFTYATLTLALLPLTNSGINPARTLSVAFFAGGDAIGQLWVFVLAPLVGAALAGLIYRGFVVPDGDGAKEAVAVVAEATDENVADAADEQAADGAPVKVATAEVPVDKSVKAEPSEDEAREFFDNKAKKTTDDK